jgi:hypothetical protein
MSCDGLTRDFLSCSTNGIGLFMPREVLEIGVLAERHVIAHKVSQLEIDVSAATLLKSWRESNAI